MKKISKKLLFIASIVVMSTSCSDDLFSLNGNHDDDGGLLFEMSTEEMGHEVVNTGGSRSGVAMGTPSESDRFKEHALQGDNSFGLTVYRQPVPLIGSNRKTQVLTRAGANEVVNKNMTNFHDSLTIWGYTDAGTTLFDQIILTKVRNWRNSVEWPYDDGEYMKFYAIAPSLESINMSATGGSYSAAPTFTYTLPEEPDELLDVLYGESDNISIAAGPAGTVSTNPKDENIGKDNKLINLQFRHITTAIKFSKGAAVPSDITINSISISGSKVIGTYDPATDDEVTGTQGKWTPGSTTRTYELTGDAVFSTTLFLLPQTLSSEARLTVNLRDNESKDHTVYCSLEGDVWKKGFTVDYKITIGRIESGYYLSTSEQTVELEHSTNAVSSTLDVNSYRLYYDYSSGTGVPSYSAVTWDIDGVSADKTDFVSMANRTSKGLSWLTDFRGVLNADNHYNGGNNATASFTVAGQTMALSTSHDVVLSGNTSASNVNLSTHYPYAGSSEHDQETANCYIVNRIGSYTFPLVYGNKTSNGPEAACFKDHKGEIIAYKLIKDQMGAKTTVTVTEANVSRYTTSYTWDATTNSTRQTIRLSPVLA